MKVPPRLVRKTTQRTTSNATHRNQQFTPKRLGDKVELCLRSRYRAHTRCVSTSRCGRASPILAIRVTRSETQAWITRTQPRSPPIPCFRRSFAKPVGRRWNRLLIDVPRLAAQLVGGASSSRPQPTAEAAERAREERRQARTREPEATGGNANEPVVHSRLPTDFAVRRR